jgi:hypothetical protein
VTLRACDEGSNALADYRADHPVNLSLFGGELSYTVRVQKPAKDFDEFDKVRAPRGLRRAAPRQSLAADAR